MSVLAAAASRVTILSRQPRLQDFDVLILEQQRLLARAGGGQHVWFLISPLPLLPLLFDSCTNHHISRIVFRSLFLILILLGKKDRGADGWDPITTLPFYFHLLCLSVRCRAR